MIALFKKQQDLLKTTFRSLQYRNFRLFWFGQCISLTGTWMQRTAQTWLVYTVTKSPMKVGLLGVAQFMPLLLFSLFAGVVVDRFSKKKLLVLTQLLFLFQAIVMTMLTYWGIIQYWHILALSFLFGLTQTLDMPARQSFFIDLVGREDLTNAISLNSTIVNLAKIVGPAISGIIMARYGTVFCFFINAVSYLPVILGILMIHVSGTVSVSAHSSMLPQVADGIRYIGKNRTLVTNVLMMAAVCTFAMNTDVIIPVYAEAVLNRGATGYSFLLSMVGIGAFIAAVIMAYLSKNGVVNCLLLISGVGTAVAQLFTIATGWYAFCAIMLVLTGFFNLLFINTGNSIFQINSSDEYRGRVMSVYSFLNLGSTPVGNFLSGLVMDRVPGDSGFLFCGITTLALLFVISAVERREIVSWFRAVKVKNEAQSPL
ncbi:MFS transporter [Caproiciproducens sp. NJN-50]|uniref:MFS transporter n=1 Tax=Acutalibacteraceae TaxID=3082771 RepID=UPI000FFE204B|nr:MULTISPECIES: MFS transporter [Acutalibacteraceae]QAT49976.1 MFS transporter [Caproiciproducens sp. NJN-50]